MKKLITVLFVAAFATFASPGCDRAKLAAVAAGTTFVDCEKEDLGQIASQDGLTLLGEVVTIVQHGGDGWQDALEALGARFGEGALACASDAARVALSSHAMSVSPPEGGARAAAFIGTHHWRFTP